MSGATQQPSKDLLLRAVSAIREYASDAGDDHSVGLCNCDLSALADQLEHYSANEPPAVTGEVIDAARAALSVDTNVTYPSHVAARQVRHVIRELITAYERLHTLYVATCTNYCRERERASQPPPAAPSIEPIARVINNNQPGWTNIVETAPNVTLDVGTNLYSLEAVLRECEGALAFAESYRDVTTARDGERITAALISVRKFNDELQQRIGSLRGALNAIATGNITKPAMRDLAKDAVAHDAAARTTPTKEVRHE